MNARIQKPTENNPFAIVITGDTPEEKQLVEITKIFLNARFLLTNNPSPNGEIVLVSGIDV